MLRQSTGQFVLVIDIESIVMGERAWHDFSERFPEQLVPRWFAEVLLTTIDIYHNVDGHR